MKKKTQRKLSLGKIRIAAFSHVSQQEIKGGARNITKSPTCGITTHSYDPTCH